MKIEEIDKNFAPLSLDGFGEIDWYDVHTAPIKLYGAYDNEHFFRMNPDVAEKTSPGVKVLFGNTAGIRARFATDSPFLALSYELDKLYDYTNMSVIGYSGFDLYDDDSNIFQASFSSSSDSTLFKGATYFRNLKYYEAPVYPNSVAKNAAADKEIKKRCCTLNFPSYAGVKQVYIGIKKGCGIYAGKSYKSKKIVYYGSSITQGACASRPGMSYQNIIARRNNADYINLGFSGNAHGEETMADYIASLDTDMFVLDYDHNACSVAELEQTHERMFKRFRAKHPNTPVIMISAPTVFNNKDDESRRSVIRRTYENAKNSGDKNVYLIDGRSFFYNNVGYEYTVDGIHPTDAGFVRMAEVIGDLMLSIQNE